MGITRIVLCTGAGLLGCALILACAVVALAVHSADNVVLCALAPWGQALAALSVIPLWLSVVTALHSHSEE